MIPKVGGRRVGSNDRGVGRTKGSSFVELGKNRAVEFELLDVVK